MTDLSDFTAAEALKRFSHLLGIPEVSRIVKRGRDPTTARFTIEMADGRQARIGTAKTLASQAELGRALFVAIDVYPDKVKAGDWHAMLRGLSTTGAIEVEEIQGERFEDTVSEALTDYLDSTALDVDKDGAAAQGAPFRDNGHVHVSAQHLARYMRREHSEQVGLGDLRQALTDIGYERKTIMYRRGKRPCSRSYYVADAEPPSPDDGPDTANGAGPHDTRDQRPRLRGQS